MPYSIRKLPGKNKYRVTQTNTGEIRAKGTSLKKAQAQVRLLYMLNRMKMSKK